MQKTLLATNNSLKLLTSFFSKGGWYDFTEGVNCVENRAEEQFPRCGSLQYPFYHGGQGPAQSQQPRFRHTHADWLSGNMAKPPHGWTGWGFDQLLVLSSHCWKKVSFPYKNNPLVARKGTLQGFYFVNSFKIKGSLDACDGWSLYKSNIFQKNKKKKKKIPIHPVTTSEEARRRLPFKIGSRQGSFGLITWDCFACPVWLFAVCGAAAKWLFYIKYIGFWAAALCAYFVWKRALLSSI